MNPTYRVSTYQTVNCMIPLYRERETLSSKKAWPQWKPTFTFHHLLRHSRITIFHNVKILRYISTMWRHMIMSSFSSKEAWQNKSLKTHIQYSPAHSRPKKLHSKESCQDALKPHIYHSPRQLWLTTFNDVKIFRYVITMLRHIMMSTNFT